MVERALADPSIGPERAERYLTMIHVDLDDQIRLDDGTPIDIASFKEASFKEVLGLSSYSWLLTIKGAPLWLTHKTRTPKRAMRRALRARDRCCAYPGCTNVGYLESHHVIPYAQRQEAGRDCLALLCGFHHRWLHHRGESLARDEEGGIVVKRSDGTVWTGKHPPPEAPDRRRRRRRCRAAAVGRRPAHPLRPGRDSRTPARRGCGTGGGMIR